MAKGREYEFDLANEIYEETDGALMPQPMGYSGNHGMPSPDLCIDDGRKIHALEIKRVGADRVSVVHAPDNPDRDDIHQLLQFARDFPRTVASYIGVRFDRRQLILAPLWVGGPDDITAMRSAANSTVTDVRLTNSNNLSVHKPSTNIWPSASTGNDARYLLEEIGYMDDSD